MHRYTWDLHYQPLDQLEGPGRLGGPNLPIAAIGHNTVSPPTTPWVNPGQFTVTLTVNGKSYTQPITVKQDPRVKTPLLALQEVYTLSKAMYYGAVDADKAARQAQKLRDQAATLKSQASGDAAQALTAFDGKVPVDALKAASTGLAAVMNSLQGADVKATAVQLRAIASARTAAASAMAKWTALKTVDLAALNAKLKAAGLAPIALM
jgi:hypothetical protein